MNVFIKVTSQVSVLESVLNSLKADLKKQYYIHHVSISFTFVWVFQFQGQICHPDTMLVTLLVKRFGDISDRKSDRISNVYQFRRRWNLDQKSAKMTKMGKIRIQSLLKVGYVIYRMFYHFWNFQILIRRSNFSCIYPRHKRKKRWQNDSNVWIWIIYINTPITND